MENTTTITEGLFIEATRTKLRIPTHRGTLSVEDLWDLSLTDLDAVAVELHSITNKDTRKTFLNTAVTHVPKEERRLEIAFDIVKYVLEVRQEEGVAKKVAKDKKAELEFLKGLKNKKALEAFANLSEEELDARIAAASQ